MTQLKNDAMWNELQIESKSIENSINSLERKQTGSYYTGLELTDVMMKELVTHLVSSNKPIWEYKFLEPCVGTGNFVFSYLKRIYHYGITREEAIVLLNNIYVADIYAVALQKYKELLSRLVQHYWDICLDDAYFDSHIGGGLILDITSDEARYISITDVFPKEVVGNGFDIIATNPPYKNLKAERAHYQTDEQYQSDKSRYSNVSEIVNGRFKYSTKGILNLYKLFTEEIIDRYAAPNAFISLLVPASILSDKTCEALRTHILLGNNLISIKVIGEDTKYVDAQQSLSAILVQKGAKTKRINIVKDFANAPSDSVDVSISDIIDSHTGNAIIPVTQEEYKTIKLLRTHPTVSDYPFIKNLRGELDLTANKGSIITHPTDYQLLRGRNISFYALRDIDGLEYVSEDFVEASGKNKYIHQARIACQQIANMNKQKRVNFAFVPSGYVLGNSCNFIFVEDNNSEIDIYALLGLFNTEIINWYFKLTSSNNHINNYEIDTFPIPECPLVLMYISDLVCRFKDCMEARVSDLIEQYARIAYGLDKQSVDAFEKERLFLLYYSDIKKILPSITVDQAELLLTQDNVLENTFTFDEKFSYNVAKGIIIKYKALINGYILNHSTFKLSDLDLEMIRSVPQGGSWKDIPSVTVEKSTRLKRITQTGGRTTLYGRIDYHKPSYTITTYFNRPGNGTYVHPIHQRVLSVREAARFQCFPDDYYFFGNKSQVLKQVGNAVPSVLAYQLARKIVTKVGCRKSVDLFSGAGGMTIGFKEAGIHAVISNDIDESSCTTLKINNPEINVFQGDITTDETKDLIVDTARREGADIICGGPPCQGFSMAGFRLTNDPRNRLFLDFVDVVSRVNPKVVIFENVEGLLSYNKGLTYKAIHQKFSEIGYLTEGRLLLTSEYAVPQRRKRVIIICVRDDLDIAPADLYPEAITKDPKSQITAFDTIHDLESVDCTETAQYQNGEESDIVKLFKRKLSYREYVEMHTPPDFISSAFFEIGNQLLLNIQ